ncbi:MAG TPA: hypothetical protein VNI01_07710 [Elusimicrobiota bacterium]|nr:hypothetical protein [Elusimicrobiota bacterium]
MGNTRSIVWIFFLLAAMILGPLALRPRAPEKRLRPQGSLRRQLVADELRDAPAAAAPSAETSTRTATGEAKPIPPFPLRNP